MASDNDLTTTLLERLQSDIFAERESAIYEVQDLGDDAPEQVIPLLIELLKDPDEMIHYAVTETLAVLKPPAALEPLIAAIPRYREESLAFIAEALGNIGDRRAVDSLISLLSNDDEFVRMYAAEALGKLGDPRAIEPLIARLSDTDKILKNDSERVCDYAVAALRKIDALDARIAVERFENGEFTPKPWWQFWK